jgi:hypothetical protein
MTILSMIQNACKRVNLTSPNTAIGNTDESIVRLVALANEEGQELAQEYSWQRLITESTFQTVATESQGAITTLAGASFGWIKNETLFNRTQKRRWYPMDDIQWQAMKADGITGPDYYFRIRGNNLIVQPTPAASETVAFEWVSRNWCQSSGGTGQSAWTLDTDTGILDEAIMTEGVIWRWKQVNGFDYGEDFRKYVRQVANATARDGAKRRIRMGGTLTTRFLNNRNVSSGSWTL